MSVIRPPRWQTDATPQALRNERTAIGSRWLPPHEADELRAVVAEQAETIEVLFATIVQLRRKVDA